MTMKSTELILRKLWFMEDEWRRIVTCCGDYYLGNNLQQMVLSFVTYKRICDSSLKDQHTFDVREKWTWTYFINSKNKYKCILDAVYGINYVNFERLPYGEYLIPRFPHFDKEDEKYINKVLDEWSKELDDINLADLSEKEWGELSKYLRNGMHQ